MKVAVLIDGGYTRVLSRKAGFQYKPDFIEKLALASVIDGEQLFRALYYDCSPFNGEVEKPVSGEKQSFTASGRWLDELAKRDQFAVRRGVLKFRGFKPKKIPIKGAALVDQDFAPDFEQKGVDMRLGLDMANFAHAQTVERLILYSNDTDCVPAMKYARIRGQQIVVVRLPGNKIASEIEEHADFIREIDWPK